MSVLALEDIVSPRTEDQTSVVYPQRSRHPHGEPLQDEALPVPVLRREVPPLGPSQASRVHGAPEARRRRRGRCSGYNRYVRRERSR